MIFYVYPASFINNKALIILFIPLIIRGVMDSNTKFTHNLDTITIAQSKMKVRSNGTSRDRKRNLLTEIADNENLSYGIIKQRNTKFYLCSAGKTFICLAKHWQFFYTLDSKEGSFLILYLNVLLFEFCCVKQNNASIMFLQSLQTYLKLSLVYNRNTYNNVYYTQGSSNNNSFYICFYFLYTQ